MYACITPRPHWLVCLVGTIVRCLTALAILQGVFSATKGVHVEEVSGEHRRCLGMQELPVRSCPAMRSRWLELPVGEMGSRMHAWGKIGHLPGW